jgi:DegV family protein with EDD domain
VAEPTVRIVVDSTADLPPALAAEHGVGVVPLTVRFGDEVFRDGVDLTPGQFLERLTSGGPQPTTAQPSPGEFLNAFRPSLAEGASVIALILSSKLSGAYSSALVAAREAAAEGGRVDVVDSRTIALACGLVALEAARAANAGADHAAVMALIDDLLGRTHLVAALDTLEYVQRGGRIGRAQALIGSLLSIKPLVTVADGVVTPLEQVRTRQRALTRLVERIAALAEREIVRLAILHAADEASALEVRDRVAPLVPADRLMVAEVGPVIATYTGPRGTGFAALTAR